MLKLSLGPIQFFWPRAQVLGFYEQAATWPLDTIYIGEVVCARRYEIRVEDWIDLARDLAASGKEVVLSSQTLLETEIDLRRLRKYAEQGVYKLEANDLGAAKLAREHALAFVAGQMINIYNEETLALFASLGAMRWVAPMEMPAKRLEAVIERSPAVESEVFGWGRMPLAFSARCFTARHYNLRKDRCEFKCQEHPDALLLKTREGKPFLAINGIQTMSAACQALFEYMPQMEAMGVSMFRLSPQSQHMADIVRTHDALRRGQIEAGQATRILRPLAQADLVDGYWLGAAGCAPMEDLTDANT